MEASILQATTTIRLINLKLIKGKELIYFGWLISTHWQIDYRAIVVENGVFGDDTNCTVTAA